MTGAAIKERGETAFGEAGDGVVLRFRNSDLKRIESVHPEGANFFTSLFNRNLTMSFEEMEIFLEHGVKKNGEPYKIPEDVLDDMPVMDVMEKVFEALCRSMRGKSFKEYLEEAAEAFRKAVAAGEDPNPPMGPAETTSTSSEERASEQA